MILQEQLHSNTPNDTEICALPQGLCHESVFIKKAADRKFQKMDEN